MAPPLVSISTGASLSSSFLRMPMNPYHLSLQTSLSPAAASHYWAACLIGPLTSVRRSFKPGCQKCGALPGRFLFSVHALLSPKSLMPCVPAPPPPPPNYICRSTADFDKSRLSAKPWCLFWAGSCQTGRGSRLAFLVVGVATSEVPLFMPPLLFWLPVRLLCPW